MRRLAKQGGIRVGLVGAALGLLLAVACSAAATDSPTPTKAASAGAPTSTPPAAPLTLKDYEAWEKRQAAAARVAAAPAATTSLSTKNIPAPLYWPTFADYEIATSPYWSREGTSWPVHPSWQDKFPEYALGYAATECVAGRELSSEGFRAFVTEVSDGRPGAFGGENNAIQAKTNGAIGQMFALSASGARLDCLNPYLHPATGTEVTLAVDLVYAAGAVNLPKDFRVHYRAALNNMAFPWLGKGAQQGQTILQMFRDQGRLKQVEILAHVPVPKNTRGMDTTAWASERELWELQEEVARLRQAVEYHNRQLRQLCEAIRDISTDRRPFVSC